MGVKDRLIQNATKKWPVHNNQQAKKARKDEGPSTMREEDENKMWKKVRKLKKSTKDGYQKENPIFHMEDIP